MAWKLPRFQDIKVKESLETCCEQRELRRQDQRHQAVLLPQRLQYWLSFCFGLFWGSVSLKQPRLSWMHYIQTGLKFEAILLPWPPENGNYSIRSLFLSGGYTAGVQENVLFVRKHSHHWQKSCMYVPGHQVTGLFSKNTENHTDLNSKFKTVSLNNKHKAITQAAIQFSQTAITRDCLLPDSSIQVF